MNRFLPLTLLFCWFWILPAQAQLQRMEVTPVEASDQTVAIFPNHPDQSAVIIESPITTLRFSSNMNGIVREMHEAERGRYVLIIEPFTQILVIDSPGYIQQRLRIGSPQPREVRYFEVAPETQISELISVIFNVTPDDARLFVDGQQTPTNETVKLTQGSQSIRIEREGYRPVEEMVEISDQNILFTYQLEEIDIVPVQIRSNVEGASVTIDGTVRGEIDRSGTRALFLYPDTYSLQVSHQGYVTETVPIEVVEEGSNIFTVELTRNIGELALQVTPPDARVLLNGEDYSGQSLNELKPGRYRLDVESQGFEPHSETIEIGLNERTEVRVDLVRNIGELALQVTPPDARVLINREDYSGQSLIELAPGRYRLDVEKNFYKPYSETIDIALNQKINREITLEAYTGTLQYSVTPNDAQVELIDVSGRKVNEWSGIKLLRNLQAGPYTLKATASGHLSKEQRIEITADETLQISMELEEGWSNDTQDTIVDVRNPRTGKTWMDRNLGASRVATSSTDARAYGDLYQWGRGSDGHQERNTPKTSTLSNSNQPGHGDFIMAPDSPYDWRSPQNDNLWQGVEGENNPCPNGYRLPTAAEWEAELQSWGPKNSVGAITSPLKLPLAGTRDNSNASLINVGSSGGYWSSTVNNSYAQYLYFANGYAEMASFDRALGLSVRCIKD